MTMTRFRRVAQLWNWLPGFRGVAEHESVHKAGETLGISPSALSRTVKQLESALGAPLFVRAGSGLQLTPFGSELLTITRNVMRQIDDCIVRDEARRGGEGAFYIGVTSDLASALIAHSLVGRVTGASAIHVSQVAEDQAADELLHGNLDVAIVGSRIQNPELVSERIGEGRCGIYAGLGHPLCAEPEITSDQLEAAPYVALTAGATPPGARIACHCDSVEIARTLCESGALLCALPDLVVVHSASLRRLADAGEPVPLYALHRSPVGSAPGDARLAELVGRLRTAMS